MSNKNAVLQNQARLKKVCLKGSTPVEERLHVLPIMRVELMNATQQVTLPVGRDPHEVVSDGQPGTVGRTRVSIKAGDHVAEYRHSRTSLK
jgi:hypothetical protein